MVDKNTKETIINAGIGLFHEKGYNAAGLQEILKVAGVPKGSFYHFFKSKEVFGKEVLIHYSDAFKPLLQQYLIDSQDAPLSRLEVFFDALIQRFDEELECKGGCLIGNIAQEMSETNDSFRIAIKAILNDWQSYFVTCLEEAQQTGELSQAVNPGELAEVLLNSWEGALLKMKVVKSVAPLRSFKKIFFKCLIRP